MRPTLLFLAALSLTACASLTEKKRESDLQDSTDSYARAIRWSDFKSADLYRQPANPAQHSPTPESLRDIRVTAYEVEDVRPDPSGKAVDVDVTITFYLEETMTLRSVPDHQHWAWDAQTGIWHITTPLPDFRAAR